MNEKEIIYEDVHSEKYLFEMGQVYPFGSQGQYSFIIGFTPEEKIGNPYFKVYNHPTKYDAADKVIRISFISPSVITGHRELNGKQEWNLEEFDSSKRKELMKYLNSKSKNNKITVWTELRIQWNLMKHIDIQSCDDYVKGRCDTPENLENPDYVPYNMQMPNYLNLKYE